MSFGHDAPPPPSAPPAPTSIRLEIAASTHVGKVRANNEDRAMVAHLGRGERTVGAFRGSADASRGGMVLAVCDGMGGEAGGEVASTCAVDAMFAALTRCGPVVDSQTLGRRIVDAMGHASAKIQEISASEPSLRGMGTTATAVGVVDEHLVVAQVGDSRAYRLRAGKLERLTKDQTLVEMLVESGQLTPEQAESSDLGHVILQALGATKQVSPVLGTFDLAAGDVLLVCSDGLTAVLGDAIICDTLESSESCERACERLLELALQRGGPDNITCIVARASGGGLAGV
jgi:protein phosphatase